ncbi:MAG: hypothetical protein U9O56_05840 [Campylobacterota bacterium]|nr:hypothetical protein [Campylobacterota bacterium]
MMNSIHFEKAQEVDDIAGVIKDIFDIDLDISGGWGYDYNNPLVVNSLDITIDQFLHMFSTMRANIEMNLLLDDENRYGGINATFLEAKKLVLDNNTFDVVTYKISAIKEKKYAEFIKEYKDGYGKKEFDITKHFENRQKYTISREVDYWFLGLEECQIKG